MVVIGLNADRRLSISILKILSILYDLSGPHRINLVKIASLFYLPIVLKLISYSVMNCFTLGYAFGFFFFCFKAGLM